MAALLTETHERFLRAIIAQVPPERIAEIHFFQPIRQGGVESGVAVVAAWPERDEEAAIEVEAAPVDAAQVEAAQVEPAVDEVVAIEIVELETDGGDQVESVEIVEIVESVAEPITEPVAERDQRYVISTARYRLTLKGIDRGKWEATVFAEADAPLITVDAVVRGVQRRSGDVDEATRMDGDAVRDFAERQRTSIVSGAP